MARTNIDINEDACLAVMQRCHLRSTRDAVKDALRLVASKELDLDAAHTLRGSGWEGDLDEMRTSRTSCLRPTGALHRADDPPPVLNRRHTLGSPQ